MRRMFKKFDTGGDATAAGNGSIDKTELGELMKTIGFSSMTDDKVRAIANALDKDGDEEISENEFVAWYARTVCHHAPASAGGRARKAPTVGDDHQEEPRRDARGRPTVTTTVSSAVGYEAASVVS